MQNGQEQIELNTLITGNEILENFFFNCSYPALKQAIEQSVLFHPSMNLGLVISNSSSNTNTCCALAALKSNVRVIDSIGNWSEESFMTYINNRAINEVSNNQDETWILIPENKSENIISGFVRTTEEDLERISIRSIAYHFQLEEDSTIKEVGMAICTADNQIYFVEEACNFLQRKRFDLFTDSKLLADIIMTYPIECQGFNLENGSEGLNRLLNNLFTNIKKNYAI